MALTKFLVQHSWGGAQVFLFVICSQVILMLLAQEAHWDNYCCKHETKFLEFSF